MRITRKATAYQGDAQLALENKFAVAIARGSTVEQQTTLVTQAETLRAYAAQQGLSLLTTCEDSGTSAEKVPFFERPEALRAVNLLLAQGGHHLLVTKVDRAFRDFIDCGVTCKRLWAEYGISVHFTDEGLVSSRDRDQMFIQIRATVAEEENLRRKKRQLENFATLRRLGARCGKQPPFGWEIDESRPRPTRQSGRSSHYLAPHPGEQRTLDRMFGWIDAGWSTSEICHQLNDEKVCAKRGGPWFPSTVQSVLEHSRLTDGAHLVVENIHGRLRFTRIAAAELAAAA